MYKFKLVEKNSVDDINDWRSDYLCRRSSLMTGEVTLAQSSISNYTPSDRLNALSLIFPTSHLAGYQANWLDSTPRVLAETCAYLAELLAYSFFNFANSSSDTGGIGISANSS